MIAVTVLVRHFHPNSGQLLSHDSRVPRADSTAELVRQMTGIAAGFDGLVVSFDDIHVAWPADKHLPAIEIPGHPDAPHRASIQEAARFLASRLPLLS